MDPNYFFELGRKAQTVAPVNKDGFIEPMFGDVSDLSQFQRDVGKEIVLHSRAIVRDELVSVYIQGAVFFYGENVRFDTIMVVSGNVEKYREKVLKYLTATVGLGYPMIKYFNNLVISERDLFSSRYLQFRVKILSAWIHGKTLHSEIRNFKLNNEVCRSIHLLETKIEEARRAQVRYPSYFALACKHLVKHLFRASFELTISKQEYFTRDIGQCVICFKESYSDQSELADKLYSYLSIDEIVPESFFLDVDQFLKILDTLKSK